MIAVDKSRNYYKAQFVNSIKFGEIKKAYRCNFAIGIKETETHNYQSDRVLIL